jgi:threonine dehydratase
LTIFASRNAVHSKLEAMSKFGARVVLEGEDFDEAKDAAAAWAKERNVLFVEDGAHPEIAEGAGTMAIELTEQLRRFDAILCPLGNGALAAGIGGWISETNQSTQVVAVCAAGAPSMALSFQRGAVVQTEHATTIADGIAIRRPVPQAVSAICELVHDVVLVQEQQLREATRLLERELGRVIEPAGAAGMAAAIADPCRWAGKRVAIPLCGGNV